jgi:hypothetical protein
MEGKAKRNTTEQEQEALAYLNELRDSGTTNMFGARPYLANQFGLDKAESQRLLRLWMDNFDEEGNYEQVAA